MFFCQKEQISKIKLQLREYHLAVDAQSNDLAAKENMISSLRERLEASERELDQFRSKCSSLGSSNDTTDRQRQELQLKLACSERQVKDLQDSMARDQRKIESLQKELYSYQQKQFKMDAAGESTRERKVELEDELATIR